MAYFKVGDRVSAKEGQSLPDGRIVPREVVGIVDEVIDAQEVYPRAPEYHPAYKGERKKTKFPAGSVVCRVKIDGETHRVGPDSSRPSVRMFHESQLQPA